MFLPFLLPVCPRKTSQASREDNRQSERKKMEGGDLNRSSCEFHALSRAGIAWRSMRLLRIYARKDALHAARERLECINRSMYNGEQSGGKR